MQEPFVDHLSHLKTPLAESGVEIAEVQNHGVIIINGPKDVAEVIRSNECDIKQISDNVRKSMTHSVSGNSHVSAQVQAEMQKMLTQLEQL